MFWFAIAFVFLMLDISVFLLFVTFFFLNNLERKDLYFFSFWTIGPCLLCRENIIQACYLLHNTSKLIIFVETSAKAYLLYYFKFSI